MTRLPGEDSLLRFCGSVQSHSPREIGMTFFMKCLGCLGSLLVLSAGANAAEIQEISVRKVGAEVVISVKGSDGFQPPSTFVTDQPPRIVVDLPGTESSIHQDPVEIDFDVVEGYQILSADGKSRLVIDLARPASYRVESLENSLEVAIEAAGDGATVRQENVGLVAADRTFTIQGLDFRRMPTGGGQFILEFNRPGVEVSSSLTDSGVSVQISNLRLSSDQYRRLDVVDFATPVQLITPEDRGNGVRFFMEVVGAVEYLSYQTGNQLVVEINPKIAEAIAEPGELALFGDDEYVGEPVTLHFQDMQVRTIFSLLAEVANRNIVVSDEVSGSVTIRLTNVPWDQALDIVMKLKGLGKRESGNVIWIAPAQVLIQREEEILEQMRQMQQTEPLATELILVSYADAEELANLIRTRSEATDRLDTTVQGGSRFTPTTRSRELSTEAVFQMGMLTDVGTISVDKRTNTLIVSDRRSNVANIRRLVEILDRPVRQVLIQSRIVVARSDFNYALGVRFGVTGARTDSRGNLYTTSGSSGGNETMVRSGLINRRGGTGSSTPVELPGLDDRLNVNLPVSNAAGSLGLSILAADYMLDLELSALETEGRGEVISTPRVITQNNLQATIEQGVEIPYESLQGGNQAGAVNVEFKEAALKLDVTPRITPDDRVSMRLAINQDTVGEIFETGRGGSVPSIDTRRLETNVLVENGQTVVLGGIFQEERNFSTTKVPVLGDVPVMGHLFRRRSNDDQKRELLIFVTPSIISERVNPD